MDLTKLFQAKLFQSKIFKIAPLIIGGLIIILLAFSLGLMVGLQKAKFSRAWEENYHRNFAGPRQGFFQEFKKDFGNRDFLGAHGTFGQIINLASSTIIIKSQNNTEKIIVLDNQTIIQRQQETITLNQLAVDDYIVVIGEPNQTGQILAKFIRLMPAPGKLPPPPPLGQPGTPLLPN
ncbi:MAG: hypothetical protein NTV81_04000 [Candidatus Komeilibacteria bacterium]|nr:hypothetical protein [Candidatus Komeilibacteria bacterium]